MTRTFIQNVRLIDPLSQTDRLANVQFVAGQVQSITAPSDSNLLGNTPDNYSLDNHPSDGDPAVPKVINGHGWILAPGLVDLYSESGEPGHESRETLSSLMAAGKAGGFTRLGILPTTQPAIDNPGQVAQQLQWAQPHFPELLPWGALTCGLQGKQLTDLQELAACGIVGFSEGQPLANPVLLRRLLEYLQGVQKPIALWPCDRNLTGNGQVREGADAIRLGFSSIPSTAETVPLATLLELVTEIRTPIHLMRISTARSVALIQDAKHRGLPITASVSWMHLMFSTADLDNYDPSLRLDPPLGTPTDQQALIAGLEDGILDAIAIDHRAYTYEEKTVAFGNAPSGAIGLELALPILWQTFVASGRWTALQLWQYLSTQPAQCLGLEAPNLKENQVAELILFNPGQPWTVDTESLKSLASNTPWFGKAIKGRVEQIWMP